MDITINGIDVNILLNSYNLVERLYKNGPYIEKKEILDIWYKTQKIMMESNPNLVEERKKQFNDKLLYNYELLNSCLEHSSNGQVNGIADDYWYETAKMCEQEIDKLLGI